MESGFGNEGLDSRVLRRGENVMFYVVMGIWDERFRGGEKRHTKFEDRMSQLPGGLENDVMMSKQVAIVVCLLCNHLMRALQYWS
jgi:hypothetical protein